MNIWETLGIERTTDLNEIKRAYARRAKEWHPEEYPEEFQKLQNAYKAARVYARSEKSQPIFEQEETPKQEENRQEEIRQEKSERKEIQQEERQRREHEQSEWWAQFEQPKADNGFFQSMNYDYSSVEKAERRQQNQEQFWKSITYMIWNPWIRNNSKHWEYYFKLAEIQELFEEEEFRFDFVKRICQESPVNWHRSQIYFFDEWLKRYETSSHKKATASKEWIVLRKKASKNKKLLTAPCVTKEEKKVYQTAKPSSEDMQRQDMVVTLRRVHLEATAVRKAQLVGKKVAVNFAVVFTLAAAVLWRVLFYRFYDSELENLRKEYEQSQPVDENQLQTEFQELMQEYEKYR